MAIVVASGVTTSLTTGLKTADLIFGRNQYVGKGRLQLLARGSAAATTGIRVSLNCGGAALIDDLLVPFTGTTGALSAKDHVVVDQVVAGGRIELFFRNDSAGTLTVDYILYFTPM